ncbi:trihelix transcription factor GT-2 isoform X1 [Amborella trichopoda]|uniref:Myb-like domain-containing protein n=1 Tax=Amborella trichopoda TaxID=13333 RepID=U5D1D3_AMBTC|nr:trihelix transcription factor GT-2 isoform X1 [Amborella trichopoda]ERN16020.1 hypothetical protein AMTR_s00030p00088210 [Amborella trichopoda]|eukprot:XP_006854553.1 trihelix transcription factor GT-2 isoform X1 [Amborella trichopoda]
MQQGGSQFELRPPDFSGHMMAISGGGVAGSMTGNIEQALKQKAGESMAEIASPVNIREKGRSGSGLEELVGQVSGGYGEEEGFGVEERESGGVGGNRWPRQETLALLKIRSDMDAAFRDATLKGPLWEDVSRKLAELGYNRSAKKCKEKFENVHKYYKRTKDGRAGRQDGKTYRFFTQLEALNSNNNNPIPSTNANININTTTSNNTVVATAGILAGNQIKATQSTFSTDFPVNQTAGISFSSGSSSDSGQKNSNSGETHKRKCGKIMAFFENLMKQVIEKQEELQQKFLDTIEKREEERAMREEAWKRQEMARVSREQEMLAHERALSASKDAAVIAFLQKFSGQNVQIPTSFPASVPAANPGTQETQANEIEYNHDGGVLAREREVVCFEVASSRWPKAEVHALIKLRSGLEFRYRETGPKGPLWEEVSAGMARLGYSRSAKRCKEKWENINKYFKKVKESDKKRPQDAKTCPYFNQLEELYKKRFKHSIDSNKKNEGEEERPMAILPPVEQMPDSGGGAVRLFQGHEEAKKPEDLMRGIMNSQQKQQQQEQQESVMDDYDAENLNATHEDEDDEDDNDGEEDANDKNGGDNTKLSYVSSSREASFMAMVQ